MVWTRVSICSWKCEKKVWARTQISTNCLFADVEKSANNEQYSHIFKKVKVRTKCTFSKHIERIPLLWLDVRQKVIYLIGCFTVGTVQIHSRTGYLGYFLRNPRSWGRISVTSRISSRYPVRQWIWTVPTVKQRMTLWRTSNHRRGILSICLEKVRFVRAFLNIRERTICTYSCSCSHFFVRTFANEWKP